MGKSYFVYILTNRWNTVIYTGITSDLVKRILDHKSKTVLGFSRKYNLSKLVYYEIYASAIDAIAREKQIKAGSRKKKIALIEMMNPEWRDLYVEIIK
jgi:putative endonuclease